MRTTPLQLRLFESFELTRTASPKPLALVPSPDPRHALSARMGALLDGRLIELVLTRNRRTILSVAPERGGRLRLRLLESFVAAPDEVLKAVSTYVQSRRTSPARQRALDLIRGYAAQRL